MRRIQALMVLVLAAGCGAPAPEEGGPDPEAQVRAFVGARLFDGASAETVPNGVLLVKGGRIQAIGAAEAVQVPTNAERIDLAGRTIVPGLINAHGHLADTLGLSSGPEHYTRENLERQLGLYARYGVTTVLSLGGDREEALRLRDERSAASELRRARILAAGPVVTATTPEAARAAVDALAAMGVDIVKIRVDDNLGTTAKMPAPVYRAVIEQAHAKGLRVAAHVFYLRDAVSLLEAGVDFIAHSIRDQPVTPELISLLQTKNVCLCPTLTREVSTFVYESEPEFFGDPFFLKEADPAVLDQLRSPERQKQMRESPAARAYKQALKVASDNLRRLSEAGVRIAFGTDTGPPARFQGYFEHMELEMMVQAGLTPLQALRAATGDAAACLQRSDEIGLLKPGAWADFVVLRDNPLEDIRNTRSIESVWVAGNRVPGL